MKIETYEVTENSLEGPEPEQEAIQLIETLGLKGQQTLLAKRSSNQTERVPYVQMTAEEQRVYSILYPDARRVTDYDAGPIPVRVLQVIAYAKDIFDPLQIWGPRRQDPDPVLVGYIKARPYLLARWGDALAPFSELRDKAVEVLKATWCASAQTKIVECENLIKAPDAYVRKYLLGEHVHGPWVY